MKPLQLLHGVPACLRNFAHILYARRNFFIDLVDKILTRIELLNVRILCTIKTNTSLFIEFTNRAFVREFTSL